MSDTDPEVQAKVSAIDRAIGDYLQVIGADEDGAFPSAWVVVVHSNLLERPGYSHVVTVSTEDTLPPHIRLGLLEYAAARVRKQIMED